MDSKNEDTKIIKYFIKKYIFRLILMVSFAFIFGNVSYDIFISRRLPLDLNEKDLNNIHLNKIYLGLTVTFAILLIISGLINMILLVIEKKFVKDSNYSLWKIILVVKTCITIFLTPILDWFIGLFSTIENTDMISLKIKFTFMLILTFISPFLRFFREYYLKPGDKGENI